MLDNFSIYPKDKVGVLYGCLPILPYLKVHEQLKYYSAIYRLDYNAIKERYFDLLGISSIYNSYIYQLSQGEKQKIGILVSIINNPQIVIWDEPFSNLDPTIIDTIWNIVNSADRTILYTTHNWDNVMHKASKVCLLYKGQLIIEPTSPPELLSSLPAERKLIVEKSESTLEIAQRYQYYEHDGFYHIFFNVDDILVAEVSVFTNNFSIKAVTLTDYYLYKISNR